MPPRVPHVAAWTVGALFSAALGQGAPEKTRLHHLHLNSTDPESAILFYTSRLESERRKFANADAVFANRSWLLFTKVAAAPRSGITSAIWHMGWGGGANMKETYQNQLDMGTTFQTPLTDISDQCDGKGGNGRFLFAYIDAPDHALIELNTTPAGNTRFGHVHLLSADAIAAGEWYVRHFGFERRGQGPISREPRYRCGRQTGPSFSMMMDDVSLIVYPAGNAQAAFPQAWQGRQELESTAGHAIDHLAFSVANLDQTLERLTQDGVRVTVGPRPLATTGVRSAFIEGPDRIVIELVEDPAAK